MVAPTSSSRRGRCGPSCASSRSRQTTDAAPAFVVVATRSAAHFGDLGRSVGAVLGARNVRHPLPCSLPAAGNSDRHSGVVVPLGRLEYHPPYLLLLLPWC